MIYKIVIWLVLIIGSGTATTLFYYYQGNNNQIKQSIGKSNSVPNIVIYIPENDTGFGQDTEQVFSDVVLPEPEEDNVKANNRIRRLARRLYNKKMNELREWFYIWGELAKAKREQDKTKSK